METSILASSVLGPILLLLGIGLFVNTKYYKNIIEHITEKSHTLVLAGIIGIIAGSYLVANVNIFEGIPQIVLSVLGWIMLLKSAFLLALPTTTTGCIKNFKYNLTSIKTVGFLYIVLGLYLINYSYYGVGFGL